MKDTNEKTKDTTQKKQNTDTIPQEALTAEPRIGEMPRRNHKDSTFCLLFSEPARAIELYNAVTGENLPPDTELTYTTLANALYIDRNNDLPRLCHPETPFSDVRVPKHHQLEYPNALPRLRQPFPRKPCR